MKNEGVYRTAPATPGLLIIMECALMSELKNVVTLKLRQKKTKLGGPVGLLV